jgi:ubiquinone/menaquinone biosynthesis C-methylase UbiE
LNATQTKPDEALKGEVRDFWNKESCGTATTTASKFSKKYFEDIENFRYYDQPYTHAFAQFTRYHDKKVVEVGFGAGIDFIQWLRAGARVTGIDLTPEAFENARNCIEHYNLPKPEEMKVSDAENLPLPDDTFDLAYSFGVLHHTPDTVKAIGEVVRVVKPGGEIKIMIYNRSSIYAWNYWVKYALLKGKPWKSVAWALWNYMESVGTKAYTKPEIAEIFSRLPVENVRVVTEVTAADWLSASAFPPLNWIFRTFIYLAGVRYTWRNSEYLARRGSPEERARYTALNAQPKPIEFSGNPLGFFHCITARKKV